MCVCTSMRCIFTCWLIAGYFLWMIKRILLTLLVFWWNRWFHISLMPSEIGLSRLLWSQLMEMMAPLMSVWLSLEALWVRSCITNYAFVESCFILSNQLWGSIITFLLIYRWYWIYAIYWGSAAIILSSGYEKAYFTFTLTLLAIY